MSDKEQTGNEASVEKVEAEEATEEKEVRSQKPQRKASKEANIIYIGSNPPMDYVLAAMTAFNAGDSNEIVLKARGRAISTAVDVTEILRNRFFKDAKVHSIGIGTEAVPSREGGDLRNVSTIEITIKK